MFKYVATLLSLALMHTAESGPYSLTWQSHTYNNFTRCAGMAQWVQHYRVKVIIGVGLLI